MSIMKYKIIIDEINEKIKEVDAKMKLSLESRSELLDGMLYTRIRDGYASVVVLINSNFHLESAIIARTIVETFFVLSAHIKNESKAFELLDAQYKHNKRKIINRTLNNKKYQSHIEKAKEFDMSELDGARDIKADEWARLSEEIDHYDYSFTFLSDYVHVNLENLEKRLDVQNNKVLGFKQNQDEECLDTILVTVLDIIIRTMELIITKHEELISIDVSGLQEKFEKITN